MIAAASSYSHSDGILQLRWNLVDMDCINAAAGRQRPSMVSSIVPDPEEASPPPQPASSPAFST